MNKEPFPAFIKRKKKMNDLLDIGVEKVEINPEEKVVIVYAYVHYRGNSFSAVGTAKYYAGFEEPETEFAIREAQEQAIAKAKELAGIK